MSQYNENPYYPKSDSGGGFVAGGSPYNGSQGGSPGGSGRKASSNSLRPVTTRMLVKATQAHADAEWLIDGVETSSVTIVAQVKSVNAQTTNSVYWLDDGYDVFEARHWVDSASEEDSGKWGGIVESTYVRVTGNLKSFGNKKYINATHIRPVEGDHELYFHHLHTIKVSLELERGPPNGSGGAAHNGPNAGGASAYSAQTHSASTSDQWAHLPPLQRAIATFMDSQPPNDEGIHVAAIARAVGGDASAISDAIDKLMDDGHVFSTIDESHYNLSK